ncbi:MAG: tungsten ABC transporter substrate-binding protein [Nitrospirae bacterium]|nr:MAG: tungsten ABC transporter substrate-binding protein [Nitrospirota bacterium]
MKRIPILAFVMFLVFSSCPSFAAERIRCASTTSTQNSGLFDYLLPLFQKDTGIEVQVIAVGTGAALELGRRGDVDLVLVHAKDDELRMLRDGWFVNRHDLMYNDFVILGPPEDPAGVGKARTAVDAFRRIARHGAKFVSRGDNSGTHKKELKLWKSAGISPDGKKWYLQVGQGMAKTLRIASNLSAYTLSDRGTYLSLVDKEKLGMSILFEGDPALFNQYGVMAVNPKMHPHVKYKEAMRFIEWLISDRGQRVISSFRDARGNQLFHPNAR